MKEQLLGAINQENVVLTSYFYLISIDLKSPPPIFSVSIYSDPFVTKEGGDLKQQKRTHFDLGNLESQGGMSIFHKCLRPHHKKGKQKQLFCPFSNMPKYRVLNSQC